MTPNLTNLPQDSNSEEAEALTQVAELYYAQGKLVEAIATCRQALEKKPDWAAAYVTMGNVQQAQGQIDEAIRLYSEAIALNPDYAEAYANLGTMLYKQGRFVEAVVNYEKALSLKSDFPAAHWNLAMALKQQGKLEEAKIHQEKASAMNPQLSSVEFHLDRGDELAQQGQLEEAIASWQRAIAINPYLPEAYCQIGVVLRYQGKFKEAIPLLQKALEIKPDYAPAHQHLCGILRDTRDLASARQAVHKYSEMCGEADPIMTAIYFISTYQVSGLNQIAKDRFLELESYLQTHLSATTALESKALYANLLFSLPYLRDNIAANSQISRLIATQYVRQNLEPNYPQPLPLKPQEKRKKQQLRIGFLSNHFYRHSVGWCCADIIRELFAITPNIYLYATEKLVADDRTQVFVQNSAKLTYPKIYPNGMANASEMIAEIKQDEIDILVDLDSLSLPIHTEILYQKPAPVCLSWLGFEAPYISKHNYFLADWHTHPEGRESYYEEQLIRMPDSFVAVAGFQRYITEKSDLRKTHRIGLDQVVYLSVAPGRKFNRDAVKAQIAILKQVPNSILIHKGLGDGEVFQGAYYQACEAEGVSKHRIKFLQRALTEEEHRTIYVMADVLLDSYPYNGGSHTLEALWFNLPVVTRMGEQFLSRMGYSFLKGCGIDVGIAQSWDEYIDWGVRFGKDVEFREQVISQLERSKDPNHLAPIWNPKKFAKDLYGLFEKLLEKAGY